jgi:hypothetical protein
MARGPLNFRQRDVAAAIRAAVQAGQQVQRVEISRDGYIIIVLANDKESDNPSNLAAEWDDLLK